MPLRTTLVAVGTFAALAATSLVAGQRAPLLTASDTPVPVVATRAAGEPAVASRIDDAIGAAVVQSIARQFATSDVVVELGDVRVRPASIQDREVTGAGRLRIDGAGPWIPFHIDAMYDTASTEVTSPRLDLGGDVSAAAAPSAAISASLDRQVVHALRGEFQDQPVAWSTGTLRSVDLGRYVRVEGDGQVDFGPDGSTAATVHGLYDREAKRWLRVRYELGGESATAAGAALASL